jgi:predicted PurR-regulated permease PerM
MLITLMGLIVHATITPARAWLDRAPQLLREVERKIRPLQRVAGKIDEVATRAERVAGATSRPGSVVAAQPAHDRQLLLQTPAAVISVVATLFLTFFLLAWGPTLLAKLGTVSATGPPGGSTSRQRIFDIAQAAQQQTARYLGTIALINVGLGLATTAMTAAFGLPTPLLWGVLAATLNFIPYAGSAVTLVVVTLVALLTQDGLGPAAGVAASYLALATIEGQLVQPLAVGRRLSVSPLIIFFALWFWGWMWGVAGMLLATPFLIALKAVSAEIPALGRIADILSPSPTALAARAQSWQSKWVSAQASRRDTGRHTGAGDAGTGEARSRDAA